MRRLAALVLALAACSSSKKPAATGDVTKDASAFML